MASELQYLQSLDKATDSTQGGCTSSLLISCVILTLTTSFVFGWDLGAPNMYNQYTEPFLTRNDSWRTQAATVPSTIVNKENLVDKNDDGAVEALIDGNDDNTEEVKPSQPAPVKESFHFVSELIKRCYLGNILLSLFFPALNLVLGREDTPLNAMTK